MYCFSFLETKSCPVTQAGLEFAVILLYLYSKYWDYRHVLPVVATFYSLTRYTKIPASKRGNTWSVCMCVYVSASACVSVHGHREVSLRCSSIYLLRQGHSLNPKLTNASQPSQPTYSGNPVFDSPSTVTTPAWLLIEYWGSGQNVCVLLQLLVKFSCPLSFFLKYRVSLCSLAILELTEILPVSAS